MRYRPAVVRLARTIVGADYAEDVAQDSGAWLWTKRCLKKSKGWQSRSPEVTRMAARELLAYFEVDEPEFIRHFGRAFYFRPRRRRRRIKCIPITVRCD